MRENIFIYRETVTFIDMKGFLLPVFQTMNAKTRYWRSDGHDIVIK